MRLRVLGRYRAGDVAYEAGQVVDVKDGEGAFLLRDSPGSFEVEEDHPPTVAESPTATGIEALDRRGRGGQRR